MEKDKVLLLGGAGFLGQGLYRALARNGVCADIVDKADMDFADEANIPELADKFEDSCHIFLLASQIGADLFERNPVQAAAVNRKIFDNVMSATLKSGRKGVRLYYYSTSEVYWGLPSADCYIDGRIRPGENIDVSNPRSAYALVKLYAERNLADRMKSFPSGGIVSSVVIRPFNVFGPGQRRGVVYSMMKSCLDDGVIRYSEDTTRTLTTLSYISDETVGLMDRVGYCEIDMSDGVSTYMKTLAEAIKMYMERKFGVTGISFRPSPPDRSIRYRQSSPVIGNPDKIFDIFKDSIDMDALAAEIMEGSGK